MLPLQGTAVTLIKIHIHLIAFDRLVYWEIELIVLTLMTSSKTRAPELRMITTDFNLRVTTFLVQKSCSETGSFYKSPTLGTRIWRKVVFFFTEIVVKCYSFIAFNIINFYKFCTFHSLEC